MHTSCTTWAVCSSTTICFLFFGSLLFFSLSFFCNLQQGLERAQKISPAIAPLQEANLLTSANATKKPHPTFPLKCVFLPCSICPFFPPRRAFPSHSVSYIVQRHLSGKKNIYDK